MEHSSCTSTSARQTRDMYYNTVYCSGLHEHKYGTTVLPGYSNSICLVQPCRCSCAPATLFSRGTSVGLSREKRDYTWVARSETNVSGDRSSDIYTSMKGANSSSGGTVDGPCRTQHW